MFKEGFGIAAVRPAVTTDVVDFERTHMRGRCLCPPPPTQLRIPPTHQIYDYERKPSYSNPAIAEFNTTMSKTGPQTGPKSVQKAHFVAWQNLAPARARAKKAGSLNPRSITPGQDPAVDAWLAMMTDGLLGGLFGGGGGKGSWKSE